MNRRLYYLLPDVAHTLKVIEELQQSGIDMRLHIKAGRGVNRSALPARLQDIHEDTEHIVERRLWNANLVVFFVALLILVVSLSMGWNMTTILMVAIMIATFLIGVADTMLPDVSLAEFDHALSHHEILLVVDTRYSNVRQVEELVCHHHPEAVVGGVSWHMGAV